MNESLPIIDVDYTTWKEMKEFLSGRVYYIKSKMSYVLVLVDLQRRFITITQLHGTKRGAKAHVVDFEAALLSTGISKPSLNACIIAEIIAAK